MESSKRRLTADFHSKMFYKSLRFIAFENLRRCISRTFNFQKIYFSMSRSPIIIFNDTFRALYNFCSYIKAVAHEETSLGKQMFPCLIAHPTFIADTKFVSETKNVSEFFSRNILCPQQIFNRLFVDEKNHKQQCGRNNCVLVCNGFSFHHVSLVNIFLFINF